MALQLFKIADTTVESAVSSVTFSSIPSGYTDLLVKFSGRQDTASGQCLITLNGSTSSYTGKRLFGSGSAAFSDSTNTNNWNPSSINPSTYTANTFGNTEIYIPNYRSSNYKSVSIDGITETNATEAYSGFVAGLWSNTAAITSISFAPSGGNFIANSTFTLYGIL
jgi:hypothetical protein